MVQVVTGVVIKVRVIALVRKNMQDTVPDIGAERRMHILPAPGKVVVPVPAESPVIIGRQVAAAEHTYILPQVLEQAAKQTANLRNAVRVYTAQV